MTELLALLGWVVALGLAAYVRVVLHPRVSDLRAELATSRWVGDCYRSSYEMLVCRRSRSEVSVEREGYVSYGTVEDLTRGPI